MVLLKPSVRFIYYLFGLIRGGVGDAQFEFSLLYFNTLFYGKSVCNCVVPQFFFTTKSLY